MKTKRKHWLFSGGVSAAFSLSMFALFVLEACGSRSSETASPPSGRQSVPSSANAAPAGWTQPIAAKRPTSKDPELHSPTLAPEPAAYLSKLRDARDIHESSVVATNSDLPSKEFGLNTAPVGQKLDMVVRTFGCKITRGDSFTFSPANFVPPLEELFPKVSGFFAGLRTYGLGIEGLDERQIQAFHADCKRAPVLFGYYFFVSKESHRILAIQKQVVVKGDDEARFTAVLGALRGQCPAGDLSDVHVGGHLQDQISGRPMRRRFAASCDSDFLRVVLDTHPMWPESALLVYIDRISWNEYLTPKITALKTSEAERAQIKDRL